ncbi:MAG: dihydrodipicolinate synthase family protein [Chromatiales bacterium]|nr:dihydrodipicolinate synthase family protein [Chromatiales bacterium]
MSARKTEWQGVFVVTVTPFTEAGDIDWTAFDTLLDTYVADGVQGVIVAGSTGEWYNLHDDERVALFERAVRRIGGRVKVLGGSAAISTRDTVALTRAAGDAGCDGVMVLPPPYALPNERELLAHFTAVAAVGVPVMVYNNPGRTQVNLTAPVISKLAELDTVVALKESTKDLYQIATTVHAVGERLAVFSGLEPYAVATIGRGAVGIVSMGANILGADAVDLWRHARDGEWAAARAVEQRMDRLYEAFYAGGYGAYVVIKACMNLVGRPAGFPRRPHLPVDAEGLAELSRTLTAIGARLVESGDR